MKNAEGPELLVSVEKSDVNSANVKPELGFREVAEGRGAEKVGTLLEPVIVSQCFGDKVSRVCYFSDSEI